MSAKPLRRSEANIAAEKALKRKHACFNPKHEVELLELQKRISALESDLRVKEEQFNAEDEALVRQETEREELETRLKTLTEENAKLLAEIGAQKTLLAGKEQELQDVEKGLEENLTELRDKIARLPEDALKELRKTQKCFTPSHRGLEGMARFNLTPPELMAISKSLMEPSLSHDLRDIVHAMLLPMFAPMKLEEIIRKGCKSVDIALAQIRGLMIANREDSDPMKEIFKRTFDRPPPGPKPEPPKSDKP